LEVLGEGAQGSVYLAEDDQLGRKVALKVSTRRPDGDPNQAERFRREANALSRLEHPSICTIYERGRANGFDFIAMQYVAGETLASEMGAAASAENLPHRLLVLERIAEALHAAHRIGLVHRDIKPSNIIVRPDGVPVLCDFGLVRDLSDADEQLTRTGEVFGTPLYMAPEQIRGDTQPSARTDLFSLGVVAYEYLTGVKPFEATTMHGAYRRILEEEPAAPSRVVPGLPRDLDAVLARALKKDPEQRYATAAEFAVDLGRVRRGEPLRVRRWGPLAAAVLITVAVTLWLVPPQGEDRSQEIAQLEREGAWSAYVAAIAAADAALDDHSVAAARRHLESCPEELRGWEWRYLWHRSDNSLGVLVQNEHEITALDVDAAGKRLLYGDAAGVLHLRDLVTGATTDSGVAHTHGVTRLALSPDGTAALSTGNFDRHAVSLWDLTEGFKEVRRAGEKGKGVYAAPAFLSDGAFVIATADAQEVTIYESDGAERVTFAWGDASRYLHVLPMPGGTEALVLRDSRLCIAGLDDGRVRRGWRLNRSKFGWPSVSADGLHAIFGHYDHWVSIVDLSTGHQRQRLVHRRPIAATGCLAATGLLVACGRDGLISLWDPSTAECRFLLHGSASRLWCITQDPRRYRLLTGAQDGSIRAWSELPRPANHVLLTDRRHSLHPGYWWLDWAPDGSALYVASRDVVTRIVEPVLGRTRRILRGTQSRPSSRNHCAASPDGRWLAYHSGPGEVSVLELTTGRERELRVSSASSMAWMYDSRTLLIGTRKGSFFVDPETGAAKRHVGPRRNADAIAAGPRGDRDAVSVPYGDILVYRTGSESPEWVFREHTEYAQAIRFSPTGERLATASWDGTVRIWNLKDGHCEAVLAEHNGFAQGLDWHPGGDRLATSGADGSIRIWDADRGQCVLVLKGHDGYVSQLRFSPDGARLASVGFDGTVRIWETELPEGYQDEVVAHLDRRDSVRKLVDALFAQQEFSLDVVQALRDDPSLSAALRLDAISEAYSRTEDWTEMDRACLDTIRRADRGRADYERVLVLAKRLDRLQPRIGVAETWRGAALYRLGDFRRAEALLGTAVGSQPLETARRLLLAMTVAQLGDAARARDIFDRADHPTNQLPDLLAEARRTLGIDDK